ncbi:hypothetical protein HDV00_006872 [Rhizophlyctis rosea]|nr:hypothetical protein HDV00_006872 [Rhizophlyctis rosea]
MGGKGNGMANEANAAADDNTLDGFLPLPLGSNVPPRAESTTPPSAPLPAQAPFGMQNVPQNPFPPLPPFPHPQLPSHFAPPPGAPPGAPGALPWTRHHDALLTLGLEDFGHANMPSMDYFASGQQTPPGALHASGGGPSGMRTPRAGSFGAMNQPPPLGFGMPLEMRAAPAAPGTNPLSANPGSGGDFPLLPFEPYHPHTYFSQQPIPFSGNPYPVAPAVNVSGPPGSIYKTFDDPDLVVSVASPAPSAHYQLAGTPSPSMASSSESMSPSRHDPDGLPDGRGGRVAHGGPGMQYPFFPSQTIPNVSLTHSTHPAPHSAIHQPVPHTTSTKPGKKPIVEEDAICSRCTRFLGVLLLHTSSSATSPTQSPTTQPYTVNIVCATCDPAACAAAVSAGSQVGGLVPGSKKRGMGSRGEGDSVVCEVCKKVNGVGGVRVIERWKGWGDIGPSGGGIYPPPLPHYLPHGGPLPGTATGTPILSDTEPDFGVEFVCQSCRTKYALCTECGGGGKYRTGKWRPVGLFLPGRRTCRLPHVRIGSSTVTFKSFTLPDALSSTPVIRGGILRDIGKHVPAMYYHRLAVPEVMEIPPPNSLSTWEELEERVRVRCERLRELVLEESVERRYGLRRYFGGAWVERVSRHARKGRDGKGEGKDGKEGKGRGGGGKGRGKGAGDGDPPPTIITTSATPTPTPGPSSSSTNTNTLPDLDTGTPSSTSSNNNTPTAPENPQTMVGMMTLLWCRPGGILWITAFQGLNTEFSANGVMFRLCRRMVEKVLAEHAEEAARAAAAGIPLPDCKSCTLKMDGPNPNPTYAPPIHSLGLPVFEEFASLPGVSHTLRRLGFLPMEEYTRLHPDLDHEIFERAVRDPEGVYGGKAEYRRSFFLAGVESVLGGPWGREGKGRGGGASVGGGGGGNGSDGDGDGEGDGGGEPGADLGVVGLG